MSFRIDPTLPLDDEVRRILRQQVTAAASTLGGTGKGRDRDLHGARKRLKKLRGLLRLIRPGDPAFYARENARFRDIAHDLAAGRNAGALVETVDRFLAEYAAEAEEGGLADIREALAARRDRIVSDRSSMDDAVARAAASLQEGLGALAGLSLPHERAEAAKVVRKGAKKTLAKARKHLDAASKDGEPEAFHELRKAVKYHWMHAGLMRAAWPGEVGEYRKRVKALGERLGELNDIAAMRDLLAREGDALAEAGEIEFFLGLMKRKEKGLRKDALAQAGRLFDASPKKRAAAVAKAYAKAGPRKKKAKDRRLVEEVGGLG